MLQEEHLSGRKFQWYGHNFYPQTKEVNLKMERSYLIWMKGLDSNLKVHFHLLQMRWSGQLSATLGKYHLNRPINSLCLANIILFFHSFLWCLHAQAQSFKAGISFQWWENRKNFREKGNLHIHDQSYPCKLGWSVWQIWEEVSSSLFSSTLPSFW